MDQKRIKFTKKELKKFLDERIEYWNNRYKKETSLSENAMAVCIMDTYKDVRYALFGEK